MAKALLRLTRRAVLTHFKANSGVSALIGSRFYGQVAPDPVTWPFAKLGAVSSTPLQASCVDGAEYRITVHAFAKARLNAGGGMVETAEDHCSRIAEAIEVAGDRSKLAITGGFVSLSLLGTQIMVDGGEADAFHAVIDFRGRVLA